MSTHKYNRKYAYLNLLVRSTFWRLQLKSVQTSAVVCTDYTCSLHRLRRGFEFRKRTYWFSGVNMQFWRDHCIIRHSLRYYRHSGLVIYISKLPAPSVSMPCDYRILQSPTKEQVKLVLLETVTRSLKYNKCVPCGTHLLCWNVSLWVIYKKSQS